MFPQTPKRLAEVAHVHHPIGDASPGAAWLMATAARAAEIQQLLAERHNRETLLTLHAHHAIEDRHFDPCKVAADLRVSLCHRAQATGQRFAAEVALFRVARSLLDTLTALEPGGAPPLVERLQSRRWRSERAFRRAIHPTGGEGHASSPPTRDEAPVGFGR